MIIIIHSHIKGFYSYCLAPVCASKDVHVYIQRILSDNVLSVDFNLTAEEVGQILGGN